MNTKFFSRIALLLCFMSFSLTQVNGQPKGYASQGGGTTGGGNATPVTVTTLADLKTHLASKSAAVIYVKGTITVDNKVDIKQPNKTLIGYPGAVLKSNGTSRDNSGIIHISGVNNVIVRNIIFQGPGSRDIDGRDNLTIENCRRVWIDHCEFIDGIDGNLDIKKASDYVTISWCKFRYTSISTGHRYCNLIGHSDSQTSDDGHLLITFMNNWWAEGCVERLPRVRYGHVHVVNNYYAPGSGNLLGITPGVSARIRVENNHFFGVNNPLDDDAGKRNSTTCLQDIGNIFESCSGSRWSNGKSFTPPYTLSIMSASSVKSAVTAGAGATMSSPTDNGTTPPSITYYRIQNRGTGLYLDGYGRTSNGSNVAQYANTTHVNAQWVLESAGSYYKLKNRATGLYLDGMGRTANGSICGQYSGSSSYNQQWQRVSIDGYYQFKNRGTGLFLDGYGRTTNGSDVLQHASTTHVNSQWSLVSAGGGSGDASMVKSNPEATTLNSSTSLELYQNYPNPANGNTVIAFNLAQKSNVVIHIYNMAGSLVQTSGNQLFDTGYSEIQLNVSNLQAGIYIYMISTNHGTEKRRMVIQ